jgi:hypothetical protein
MNIMSKRVVSLVVLVSILFASLCGALVPVVAFAARDTNSPVPTIQIPPPPAEPIIQPEPIIENEPEQGGLGGKSPEKTEPEPQKEYIKLVFKYALPENNQWWIKLIDETGYFEKYLKETLQGEYRMHSDWYGMYIEDKIKSMFGFEPGDLIRRFDNSYEYFHFTNIPENPLISADGMCILIFEP